MLTGRSVFVSRALHRDSPLIRREFCRGQTPQYTFEIFASLAGRRTLHLLIRFLGGVGCLFRPRNDANLLALDHSSCCYQTSSRFEAKCSVMSRIYPAAERLIFRSLLWHRIGLSSRSRRYPPCLLISRVGTWDFDAAGKLLHYKRAVIGVM